jgi:hypothetical protein
MQLLHECQDLLNKLIDGASRGQQFPSLTILHIRNKLQSIANPPKVPLANQHPNHRSTLSTIPELPNNTKCETVANMMHPTELPVPKSQDLFPTHNGFTYSNQICPDEKMGEIDNVAPHIDIAGLGPIVAWQAPHVSQAIRNVPLLGNGLKDKSTVRQQLTFHVKKDEKLKDEKHKDDMALKTQTPSVGQTLGKERAKDREDDQRRHIQACHYQLNCNIGESCGRIHGLFDPDQKRRFEDIGRDKRHFGAIACRNNATGRDCHTNCRFRHFVPTTIQTLRPDQLNLLEKSQITTDKDNQNLRILSKTNRTAFC